MTSNLSRRVNKIEQRSAAGQGGDNIFHIAKPPGMTMDEALKELGIEPESRALVFDAVWLGDDEGGKPELTHKGNLSKILRAVDGHTRGLPPHPRRMVDERELTITELWGGPRQPR